MAKRAGYAALLKILEHSTIQSQGILIDSKPSGWLSPLAQMNLRVTSTSSSKEPSAEARQPAREWLPTDSSTHERLRTIVFQKCPPALRFRVDDLAQKASLRLLANSSKKESSSYCTAFLYRIVASVIIDELRSSRRKKERVDRRSKPSIEEIAVQDSPESDPETRLKNQRTGVNIQICLERLSQERKTAVILSLQGYRASEIAQQFDWKDRRAENLVTRGRNNLRDCLRKKGVRNESS